MKHILLFIFLSSPLIAMQQPVRVYDQQKTQQLRELLNKYSPNEPVPKQEIKNLLNAGANPNCKAETGFFKKDGWLSSLDMKTPQAEDATDIFQLLLEKGANPNDWGIVSPLHKASMNGQKDRVELLINYGANVNAKTSTGFSALSYAVSYKHKNIVEILLNKGAVSDIDVADTECDTPLSFAKKHNLTEMVELLEGYKNAKNSNFIISFV